MKTKLLAMMLLAGSSMFAETRFSVGVGFGGHRGGFYQAPPSYASNIPPCPGPGYTWVDGYWSQAYGRNVWVSGNWYRQPFSAGYEVVPRFDNRFHDGEGRHRFTRGEDRNRGFEQDRNFTGRDREQARGNRDRSARHDDHERNRFENEFRGR